MSLKVKAHTFNTAYDDGAPLSGVAGTKSHVNSLHSLNTVIEKSRVHGAGYKRQEEKYV